MTERNWLERHGATPSKLATVGILAAVLGFVIWNQVSSGAKPAVAKKSPERTAPQTQGVVQAASASAPVTMQGQTPAETRQWPKLKLEKVVKNDPFAMPMWYLMAQAEDTGSKAGSLVRSAQVLEELKKQQTKIVVITEEDRVATIGEQSFRVGDMIEGFQISEITRSGIVLTETAR
ncbi:MAG: hypothetical protein SH868_16955 [Bythopirellula sp.]|nr:hypothetical protein [Bythopirellula sp.]